MHPKKEKFLNLKVVPARLTAEETAWYLGFATHDIPVLTGNGLLKPLGHPSDSSVKFFALAVLEPLRSDVRWLSRSTDVILDYWRTKNARKAKITQQTVPVKSDFNDRAFVKTGP